MLALKERRNVSFGGA